MRAPRWSAAVACCWLMWARPAAAQVSCTGPDDLCTGDPCVIPAVEVGSPCVVDFGARTVVVQGPLRLPVNGVLSLTAGTIQVPGKIRSLTQGTGQSAVTLTASTDVTVTGSILLKASSIEPTSHLTLTAGGDIDIQGRVRCGGGTDAVAGGDITIVGTIRNVMRGGVNTFDAGDRIDMTGRIRGSVTFSAVGDVDLAGTFQRIGTIGGGSRIVEAGGAIAVLRTLRVPESFVRLRGAVGVTVDENVDVRPSGSIEVESSAGAVDLNASLNAARAVHSGGHRVSVRAAGEITVGAPIFARSAFGEGGTIELASQAGSVVVNAPLLAEGGISHGVGFRGGNVEVDAGGSAIVNARIAVSAGQAPGGTVRIEAGDVSVGPGVVVDADGEVSSPSTSIRCLASAGDLLLAGTLRARGGASVIEGTASADVIASGAFQAGPSGCIAFSAGGTIDTGGGTFDRPILSDCPGSPCGAFLD